ncbi:MAG TPA: hypothetical protein VIY49_39835 [Bryobacteraceae bacterium]
MNGAGPGNLPALDWFSEGSDPHPWGLAANSPPPTLASYSATDVPAAASDAGGCRQLGFKVQYSSVKASIAL